MKMLKWLISTALLGASIQALAQEGLDVIPDAPGTGQGGKEPTLLEGSISGGDYPAEAIAKHQEGTVLILYLVDERGLVPRCKVIESSGSTTLDSKSCEIIKARFRFEPGKTAKGRPVAVIRRQRINWRIPVANNGSALDDMKPSNVDIEMIVAPDGTVKSCRVLHFETSYTETSDVACPWASKGGKLKAYEGTKDRRVRYKNSLEITEIN